jgi:glycosyltransferase involved in cell wall biosynthesis
MISIITITYNNFDELISTINSLSCLDYEHIIINGGSCSKTKEYLANEYKGITLSELDNGISDAFNKGINLASGEYISFLNSGDILIDQSYYSEAINKLQENSNLLGVGAKIKITTKSGNYIRDSFNPLPSCPFNHPGFVFRASDLKSLYFNEDLKVAMDFDLFIRLTQLDFSRVALCGNVAVEMIGGGVSQVRTDLGASEKIKSLKSLDLLRGKLKYLLYWQLFKGKIKQLIS